MRNPYAAEEQEVGPDTTAPARRRLYRSLEDDVALMERDWEMLVEKARLVRHWLDLDCRPTEGFDDLMKALGIHDRMISQPNGHMAVHEGD